MITIFEMYLPPLSPNDGRQIKYFNEVAEGCFRLNDASAQTAHLCLVVYKYCNQPDLNPAFFNLVFRPKTSPEGYTFLDRLEAIEVSDIVLDRNIEIRLSRLIEFVKIKGGLHVEDLQ